MEHYELGLEYVLRSPVPATLRIGRLVESVDNQIATLFGLDAESEVGHYYVTTTGSPRLEAWVAGIDGTLGPHARASVTYTAGQARWRDLPASTAALPAGAQPLQGTVQDLTVSFDGALPGTATRLATLRSQGS